MPRDAGVDAVHALDTWTMDQAPNGQDLVLILRTSDGRAVSFKAKPWQVQGMVTIATYGMAHRPVSRTLH
jgi:hypothetical protein